MTNDERPWYGRRTWYVLVLVFLVVLILALSPWA
jgi:hypothetical protein